MRAITTAFTLLTALWALPAQAQTGLLNDDFTTGNTFSWAPSTAGSTAQLTNGQLVVNMALQSSGRYRADLRKNGGVTFHAGAYPIVAIKFNKPPRANFFFDSNLGSYNNTNNNATKIASATGNIYYWDLSTGRLGNTTLSQTAPTTLSLFQFKIADIVLTQAEIAAGDLQYEVDWVKTFPSVAALRTFAGVNNPPSFSFSGQFTHPGLLHSTTDLQRLKNFVDNQYGRPYESFQLLSASSRASASYNIAGPFPQITRDPSLTLNGIPGGTVKSRVESDCLAAYYNALMYNITGNAAHAVKSTQILDAYASTTTAIVGGDAELNGLYGFMFANAAELMRHTYSGWPQANQVQCETMLKNVFYPVLQNFRPCAHGNWDIICMKALMSIAVYCNDTAMFNRVVNYFYHGEGNGSIDNYVLTAAGQLQESNRDQPHTMLALGSMAEIAEMALKQGVDLYSSSGNAIMRGFEYTSKYNLGNTVPYETAYDYCEKNYSDYTPEAISANGRGQFRSVFEIAYNHYVYRKGLQMPWTQEVLHTMGPEGAPFGADNPGYGSLLFYLNNAPDHPGGNTNPVDSTVGLLNDQFTTTADGWATATSGATATVNNGQLQVTLATQANGSKRGDIRKTAGAILHPANYPLVAIKFKKPQVGNITFDTNLGAFGNGANRWTGRVGEEVYYYDLTQRGFGSGNTPLSTTAPTTLTTFQFKVADITSAETNYTVDWIITARSVAELQQLVPHQTQTITFNQLPPALLGDTMQSLSAQASSGLPVKFISTDTAIATVENGYVQIRKAGSVTITATQPGDSVYLAAQAVARNLTIAPLQLTVQYRDGDNGQTANNNIRPYLQLVNNDTLPVAYGELTARYWLTAENFAGVNTWIDYAQMGNQHIQMQYMPLPQPHKGAYGYVEYKFNTTAGQLLPAGTSGVIQTRLANTNWSNLQETNDHSYKAQTTYAPNEHITLYRNGILVWGEEPEAETPVVKVTPWSATQNSSANTISTHLNLRNEGNVPVNYNDLSVRYWFTTDGNAALNAWLDYAPLGNNNILRSFHTVSPAKEGADQYIEWKIAPALGNLYPASETGNIRYRITKTDWSPFTQTNDHSWQAPAPLAANGHITVYYQGQLIYGTEPAEAPLLTGTNTTTAGRAADAAGNNKITLFPNPVTDQLNIQLDKVENDAQIQVFTLKGQLLMKRRITATNQAISLQQLPAGMYQVELRNGKTKTTKQIMKQ